VIASSINWKMSVGIEGKVDVEAVIGEESETEIELEEEIDT